MSRLLSLVVLVLSSTINAQEYNPQVKNCMYVAGIAREAQNIRQVEKHNFEQFTSNVNRMYKSGEGLDQLLIISKHVYEYVGIDVDVEKVFNVYFDHCIARIPKNEGVSI